MQSTPWRRFLLYSGPPMARVSWAVSLGCWVKTSGSQEAKDKDGKPVMMMVSNHLSYIDVVAFMNVCYPAPGFVAKREAIDLPLIYSCARVWHCVYVDRGTNSGSKVIEQMIERSKHPMNFLCTFPEGTTSNGKYLLKFKRGAFVPGLPVKPVIEKERKKDLLLNEME